MSRARLTFLLAAPLFALLCSGCGGGPQAPLKSARSAIERLREQTSCSRAVKGEAALSFQGRGWKLKGKVLYLAQAPDRLRFDVFSSFGVTLSTLTSNGERFSLYNLQDRSFAYGPARTCNVEKFTRVPVPAPVLVELLRGRPPVLSHRPEDAQIDFRRPFLSRGFYEVQLAGEHQATQRLRLGLFPGDENKPPEEQRLRLLEVRVEQAGRGLFEARLSGHQPGHREQLEATAEEAAMGISPRSPSGPECSAELPQKVEFYVPSTGYRLTVDNQEVVHNPPLLPASFEQNRPAGVQFYRSDCE